jgi:hypothetical protein
VPGLTPPISEDEATFKLYVVVPETPPEPEIFKPAPAV